MPYLISEAERASPVLVETDFEVNVLDSTRPEVGLVTAAGETIRYTGRLDLMAVDAHDEYWIVRHRVVDGDWLPTAQLAADEEALAVPSPANCPPCPYVEPCRALQAGRDAQPILASRYRKRPALVPQEGRLGGRAWSLGRGAAPPRFRRSQDG